MDTEQVDIAIVGAGLAGLASAVALVQVRPDARIKVYDRRPRPAADTPLGGSTSSSSGGGVRLKPNGLRAAAAVSPSLASALLGHGVYARKVLLHDTAGGAVVKRLQEPPHAAAPSPRQPGLMIGWSELESLLLQRLPPDTVEWGVVATGYRDGPSGVTLQLLKHATAESANTQAAGAPDSSADGHGRQPEPAGGSRGDDEPSTASRGPGAPPPAPGVSPFASQATLAAAAGAEASPASHAVLAGADTLASWERLPSSAEHQHDVPPGVALKEVAVSARLLIAADGPTSQLRQQCVGDGLPQFEDMVRWVGRLPGDMLSAIPVEQEAWWMGPGVTWASHPLSNGDVAWEAQASSTRLAEAGMRWDSGSQRLVPVAAGVSNDSQSSSATGSPVRPGSSSNAPGLRAILGAAEAPAGDASNGGSMAAAASEGQEATAAAAAAPPRGNASAELSRRHSKALAAPTVVHAARSAAGSRQASPPSASPDDPTALLRQLFAGFPTACLDMLSATPPEVILQGAVLTRPAKQLPPSLGRGSVVVIGEAAHPVRPAGQEASQALEDAAELGAAIMLHGCSREALRRFELHRRPRWLHAMQVSQAFASCSNLGDVALHQGLLDYTAQLYYARFVPLRRVDAWPASSAARERSQARHPLVRLGGLALLAWGTAAGLAAASRHARAAGSGSSSGLGSADPVARAVAAAVDGLGASAGRAMHTAAGAMQAPGEAAAAIGHQLANAAGLGVKAERTLEAGLTKTTRVVADVALETAGVAGGDSGAAGSGGPVHGEAPYKRQGPGALSRFRDAVLGRSLAAGAFVSPPFTRMMAHRVTKEVADTLGAF